MNRTLTTVLAGAARQTVWFAIALLLASCGDLPTASLPEPPGPEFDVGTTCTTACAEDALMDFEAREREARDAMNAAFHAWELQQNLYAAALAAVVAACVE